MKIARNLFLKNNLLKPKFFFSTSESSSYKLFEDPTFYLENHENCLNKTGIETQNFKLNGKQINLYGLPQDLETVDLQQQYMNDLSTIAVDIDQSKKVLVQIDPTFHLFEKRKVINQIKKYTKYKGQDPETSQTLPVIPNNITELQLEPYLLELSRANDTEIQQIYDIINTKDYEKAKEFQGYFSKYFNGKNSEELYTENGQKMYLEFCEQVQKQIIYTNSEEKNDLVTLIVLNILKGNDVFLGDVPSIYFRLMVEQKIELDYLRNIYKQILTFMKDSQSDSIEGLYEMLLGQVFQQPLDHYLFYLIQQLSLYENPRDQIKNQITQQLEEKQHNSEENTEENTEEKEEKLETISCFISNTHIEPLKIISKHFGDKGFCRDQTFQQFMQLQKSNEGSFDAEKIEKHALLDVIFGTNLWEQEYTQANPFPYLSEDYTKLNKNDQLEIQKNYHAQVQKYQELKKQYLRN